MLSRTTRIHDVPNAQTHAWWITIAMCYNHLMNILIHSSPCTNESVHTLIIWLLYMAMNVSNVVIHKYSRRFYIVTKRTATISLYVHVDCSFNTSSCVCRSCIADWTAHARQVYLDRLSVWHASVSLGGASMCQLLVSQMSSKTSETMVCQLQYLGVPSREHVTPSLMIV